MTLMSEPKQITKNTPVIEVIKRILKRQVAPITIEDLTAQVIDNWGRDFPESPYEEACLVYKLAVGVLHCKEYYDSLPNGAPIYIERYQPDSDPILVNPNMKSSVLNEVVSDLALLKVDYVEEN